MVGTRKIHCNSCHRETKHDVLASHRRADDESIDEEGRKYLIWFDETIYALLVCRGCDTGTLELKYTDDSMRDHTGEHCYTYSYHPRRSNSLVRTPIKFVHLDEKLNAVYLEVVAAHQGRLSIICAIGIRALLEGVCVLEGIDDSKAWGLQKKITELEKVKAVPDGIAEGLRGIKFIGDGAAHRLVLTDDLMLSYAIDLIEALLTHLYEAKFDLQQKAKRIRSSDPTK